MRYQYTNLKLDGSTEVRKTSRKWGLDKLQEAVNGMIERIPNPQDYGLRGTVYVNEEGRLRGLPVNPHLTSSTTGSLVGNVLVEERIR